MLKENPPYVTARSKRKEGNILNKEAKCVEPYLHQLLYHIAVGRVRKSHGYFLTKTYSVPHYSWNELGRVGKVFPISPHFLTHFNIIRVIIYTKSK